MNLPNSATEPCFNGNRINNPDLAGLTSVQRLMEKMGKLKQLSHFSVADCESEFVDIINSADLRNFLLKQASRYASEESYSPSVTSPDFLHLLVNDLAQLYIGTLRPEQTCRNITFSSPCNFLFAPLSEDASLIIKKYAISDGWNNEVFDANISLTLVDEFELQAGQYINIPRNGPCLDNATDAAEPSNFIYDFSVEKPLIWLRLASQAPSLYQWVFDKTSLGASFMSSSSVAQTRYETIIQMISSFHDSGVKNDRHTEVLEGLTYNALHHIRWQATQILFEMDQPRGIAAVKRLKDDIHPHVANAAAASINQLRQAGLLT